MRRKKPIYIFTFHGLGTPEGQLADGEEDYWLDPSFFEAILDRVKDREDVYITFDDCNSSDFHIALPLLTKRNLGAAFFVVSDRIDLDGFMTSEQVRELVRAGMTIGSHGTRHRRWATLRAADLNEELHASRSTLESVVRQTVSEAACPFGSYNRRVLLALRAAGYTRVYTSDQGPADEHEWLSARNTIVRSHTMRYVEAVLESPPRRVRGLLRTLKLTLKRLR